MSVSRAGFVLILCVFTMHQVYASEPITYDVQAPYHSYICYDKTFADCGKIPRLDNANLLMDGNYANEIDKETLTINIRSKKDGVITKARWKNQHEGDYYQCDYGKIKYDQKTTGAVHG